MIEFRDVGFGYPPPRSRRTRGSSGTRIMDHFDLTFADGEFCAVLGPSGCGKTTILSLIAGLLRPDAGEVLFEGASVSAINTRVAYMTQTDTLLPWRSAGRNIGLPLELRHVNRDEIARRVEEQAVNMGLVPSALDRYPSQLSGGMRRRALLARSLITEPTALLMDEPFAAVDAQLRSRLHQDLRTRVEASRQTVIFVTHDVTESILLADRVITVGGSPLRVVDDLRVPLPSSGRDITEARTSRELLASEERLWKALAEANVA